MFWETRPERAVSGNRKFWKTVSHLFSEKAFHKESFTLNNNNKAIINDEELAEKLVNLNLLKNSKL